MTIVQVVKEMQGEIQTSVDGVFTEMRHVYQGAQSAALASIDVTLEHTTAITEPDSPDAPWTIEEASAYLDGLATLLHRPEYPTFSITSPTLPSLSTAPPALTAVTIPDSLSLLIPTFDAVLDDEDVAQPTVTFDYTELSRTSGLHDALYDLLLDEINNGGYGLNPADETPLFDRARERQLLAMHGDVDGAMRLFSSGGFAAPTGALNAALQRIHGETREKLSEINRDLMIQRSELYFKGKGMNQDGVLALEKLDSDLFNSVQDRALKAAAQRVTSVLEVAAFQIERLKLFMEKYKTLAYVFEVQVKAEATKVEIYKVQINASEAQIKLNMALLEEFTTRNKAIVDVFLAQVEEYKSRVDGYIKYVGALSDQYKADVAAFAAANDATGKIFDMEAKFFGSETDYASALLNSRTSEAKMKLDEAIAAAQIDLEGAKAEVSAAAAVTSAGLSAMNVNATVSAQASAGIDYSENDNTSVTTNIDG